MNPKLGKKPATHDPRDLKFAKYTETLVLPTLPSRFGYGTLFPDWGMLGNDQYGDCVFAGAAHETMLWNKIAKHPVNMTTPWVLADYTAVTGFDPTDPSTDQGTDMRTALKYRRSQGIQDGHGIRHKIGAFVALTPGNWTELLQATYLFGAVGVGIQFPASAMEQFNDGLIWDYVEGSPIEGGHYIPSVGTTARTKRATIVTWGKRQEMTRAFYENYNDESFAILSLESLSASGTWRGFDIATLNADLAAL